MRLSINCICSTPWYQNYTSNNSAAGYALLTHLTHFYTRISNRPLSGRKTTRTGPNMNGCSSGISKTKKNKISRTTTNQSASFRQRRFPAHSRAENYNDTVITSQINEQTATSSVCWKTLSVLCNNMSWINTNNGNVNATNKSDLYTENFKGIKRHMWPNNTATTHVRTYAHHITTLRE